MIVRRVRRLLAEYRIDQLVLEMCRHGQSHQCAFDEGCPTWEGLCMLHAKAYDRLAKVKP